jgi:hypothetical protein
MGPIASLKAVAKKKKILAPAGNEIVAVHYEA